MRGVHLGRAVAAEVVIALVVDENDDITWFNVAARDLLGLSLSAALNAPVPETRFGVFRM